MLFRTKSELTTLKVITKDTIFSVGIVQLDKEFIFLIVGLLNFKLLQAKDYISFIHLLEPKNQVTTTLEIF